jgi:hypothetical protein
MRVRSLAYLSSLQASPLLVMWSSIPKWNAINKELNFTSLPSTTASKTPSPYQLRTPELSYIPSQHWKLLIWGDTPVHSLTVQTCPWTHCSDRLLDWQEWCSTYNSHDFEMVFITRRTVFHTAWNFRSWQDQIDRLCRYECTSYQETQALAGHIIWYVLSVSHSRSHMMVLCANLNLHCATERACTCWSWSDRCGGRHWPSGSTKAHRFNTTVTSGNTSTTSMHHDLFDLPLVEYSAYNSSCISRTQ